MTVPAESANAPQFNSLAALQEGREAMAELAAGNELRGIFNPERASQHYMALKGVEINGVPYDEGILNAGSLLGLDALGFDVADVLAKTGRHSGPEEEQIASQKIGDAEIGLYRYDEGVYYRATAADSGAERHKSAEVAALITERLENAPPYAALRKVGTVLNYDEPAPESLKTEEFDYRADPLASVLFLYDMGLLSSTIEEVRGLRAGIDAAELPDRALATVPPYTATVSTQGDISIYTWGKNVKRELVVDPAKGTFVLSASKRPVDLYLERGNQTNEKSLPFIETECARALCDRLDAAGLMFHPNLQQEMMQIGEADRYGSIYTQLSREIAKWINNPDRARLSTLFVPADPAFAGEALARQGEAAADHYARALEENGAADIEARTRSLFTASVPPTGNLPADTLLSMAQDVLARNDTADEVVSDLPVTEERVSITNGACFDVFTYYVGAAATTDAWPDYLKKFQAGAVNMLEKNTGVHTYLTTQPTVFNGVRLPKGALFSKADDEKWAFLRLTPFAFDEPADQLAFGSEISKTLKNERENLLRLGGVSLAALERRATS